MSGMEKRERVTVGTQDTTETDADVRARRAAEHRALMPLTAAEVDRWRAVFGPGVRLTYCYGEIELGAPLEARELTVVDAQGNRVSLGRLPMLVPAAASWKPDDERGK
jgi:hypothetical protein